MSFITKLLAGRHTANNLPADGKDESQVLLQESFTLLSELLKKEYSDKSGAEQLVSAQNSHFLFRLPASQRDTKDPEYAMILPEKQSFYFETNNLLFAQNALEFIQKNNLAGKISRIDKQDSYGPYVAIKLENVDTIAIEKHYLETFPHASKVRHSKDNQQQSDIER